MTLFILAAGMGSRYGGLKQIDPFTENGEFIIDFSIYDAIKAGFDRVVFVIKKENYEVFKETVGHRIEGKVKVEYVFQGLDSGVCPCKIPAERVKPWGTTHALLCGKDVLDDPFAVINADDFYGRDAFFKAAEFLKNATTDSTHFCMVGYRLGNTLTDNGSVARGECHATAEGYLDKIVERTKLFKEEGGAYFEENGETVHLPNDTVVSMNFWGFTPKVFEGLSEDFAAFIDDPAREPLKSECLLPNTIGKMIKAGDCDVEVLTTSAKWFGVTYANDKPDVIAKLKALIAAGEYPNGLWK
ncbi:MAG: nucleotidyltransferase [Clostridiales bacterium]|nr:nucleotidyltransferase [Clostridiales bacterium]